MHSKKISDSVVLGLNAGLGWVEDLNKYSSHCMQNGLVRMNGKPEEGSYFQGSRLTTILFTEVCLRVSCIEREKLFWDDNT